MTTMEIEQAIRFFTPKFNSEEDTGCRENLGIALSALYECLEAQKMFKEWKAENNGNS